MRRREFILSLASAADVLPFSASAQQQGMARIGALSNTSAAEYVSFLAAVREGLSDKGYIEGRNLAVDYRWADNHYDRLPGLAADLVGRRVAVLVAFGGTNATLALHAATKEIP